ncbi:hypothetical protein F3Y22_tig00111806pilonHSYRG00067 [Hibiscus syriacus]|uniref:Uncharacterized protein n=1 Tax=Hibiscus syriacus TaxID=106335 RepID=A0A6A2YCS8_HIBSY|nr:hypothetical protein F3Y22_tig00111806pilonHSYRG00067 [Hibiscus syriacus]
MATGDPERGVVGGNEKNKGHHGYVENDEKQWTPWLVPMFVVANVAVFVVVMFVNDCPKNNLRYEGGCVARYVPREINYLADKLANRGRHTSLGLSVLPQPPQETQNIINSEQSNLRGCCNH